MNSPQASTMQRNDFLFMHVFVNSWTFRTRKHPSSLQNCGLAMYLYTNYYFCALAFQRAILAS